MRYAILLLAIMAIFAAFAMAGPNDVNSVRYSSGQKKKGNVKTVCAKGKKKNGKCKRSTLRVRSADSDEYFEIPAVEDAHWGDAEEE